MRIAALLLVLAACGPSPTTAIDAGGDDAPPDAEDTPRPDGSTPCGVPPNPAGADVTVAPQYAGSYTVYDLGVPPGVPNPLGGAVVSMADPNVLLIAGASEDPNGVIYAIGVTRGACGHIVGWNGTATAVATTPYVDANLVYADASGLLLYTEWPVFHLSQISPGGNVAARRTDLTTIGMASAGDDGPGGLGIVPEGLAAAGELRTVTWPLGVWHHVAATPATAPDVGLLDVTAVTPTVTLPNNPGGFAYVPAGSSGFPTQAIIVAEWVQGDATQDRVAVYDADASGDPIVATRREFLSKFPRPWGAYFEPMTGDYLFLSWGTGTDHVFIVQGFVPPPPID